MKQLISSASQPVKKIKPIDLPGVYKKLREHFGPQQWWPGNTAFEIIIGAILTQNTSWGNVEKAIHNLKKHKVLSPSKIHQLSRAKLSHLIRSAGFFRVKSRRIKNFTRLLFEKFSGDLDRMFMLRGSELRHVLLQVNGIGPETADSILLYAAQKPYFVIDAYTKRIFVRHGLKPHVGRQSSQHVYEAWRTLFESALPHSVPLYNDYHAQIVMLGKSYCKASKPLCSICPLGQ